MLGQPLIENWETIPFYMFFYFIWKHESSFYLFVPSYPKSFTIFDTEVIIQLHMGITYSKIDNRSAHNNLYASWLILILPIQATI